MPERHHRYSAEFLRMYGQQVYQMLTEGERGVRDDGDPEGDWADLARREVAGEYDPTIIGGNTMTDQPILIYRIQQELRRDPGPRVSVTQDTVNRLMLEALIELLNLQEGT